MTEAQVLALINQYIITNHSQDITAAVLNPILKAMLEQPNDVTGDLVDLDTVDKSNLVAAINEIVQTVSNLSSDITVHVGPNNPNAIPPASFQAPDFYKRVQGGGTTAVYIYNGLTWVDIIDVLNPPEKYIEIGGNLFEWRPLPNNNSGTVQQGDIALNGWISQTSFGKILSFNGSDPTNIADWEILEQIG